jgi:hypothetical protein
MEDVCFKALRNRVFGRIQPHVDRQIERLS